MTATIVTSENVEAFNLARIAPPTVPVSADAAASEAKPEGDAQAAQVDDKPIEKAESKPDPKAKTDKEDGPLQQRFSELARERREAEAKADRERDRADRAERELAAARAKDQPAATEADDGELGPKPDKTKFSDAFDYAEKLAEWQARKILLQDRRETAQRAHAEEAQKVSDGWKSRVDTFKAETPDYESTLSGATVAVHDAIRDAIIKSDLGPQILYALAKDDALAAKFAAPANPRNVQAVMDQLRALGRLEAKLEKVAEPEVKVPVKTTEREVKRAPDPITPVRGGAARSDAPPPNASAAEYRAWRESQMTH